MSGIIVTVRRQRVGGDEIPFCNSLGDFLAKSSRQMFLQESIVFRPPSNTAYQSFFVAPPVKTAVLLGVMKNH